MSEDGSAGDKSEDVEMIFKQYDYESSEEPPEEEWSSLLCFHAGPVQNEKRRLFEEGLYKPPSAEICAKYIPISDSSVYLHPLYPYPAVNNPGIEEALREPLSTFVYPDDGQELYLAICKEMNESYCRLFYKQLLNKHMDLSYYGISTYGYRAMALALKKNVTVRSIDLTSNFISEDGCYHFSVLLRDNLTITELNFESCFMGIRKFMLLVAYFHKNSTLRKINLSKNRLTDKGFEYLAKAIYKGSGVADINLSYNNLTTKSALMLDGALEGGSAISHLDLSWNSMSVPRHLEILFTRLLNSETFVEINLAWNRLSDRFAKAICILLHCPNITVINLSNNSLGGQFCKDVAVTLPVALKLTTLDLSYNPLTPADARVMLMSMRMRKVKLKMLLMDGVYVSREFVNMRKRILNLKFRKNCEITHGYVLPRIMVTLTDMRDIVLRRAQILCNRPKKKRANVGLILLRINREKNGTPLSSKELLRFFKEKGAFQLNEDIVYEMVRAFPGPRVDGVRMANMSAIADYVYRMFPETELPPTPPPEPVPVTGKNAKNVPLPTVTNKGKIKK